MPTRRRKRSKKWLWGVVFGVLLIAAGVVGAMVYNSYFTEEEKKTDEPTSVNVVKNTKTGVEEVKKEEKPEKKDDLTKKEVVKYDGEDPNEKAEKTGELTGVVTYAGFHEGNLMVRVNIDQFLGEGFCRLELIRQGNTEYETEVDVAESAASSTCAGFDVDGGELSGTNYQIKVTIEADGKNGVIYGEVEE